MTPCDYCRTPIDSDVYEEEMGMCLDCSNAYWSHNDDYLDSVVAEVYVSGR
jgi:hypothetical protein